MTQLSTKQWEEQLNRLQLFEELRWKVQNTGLIYHVWESRLTARGEYQRCDRLYLRWRRELKRLEDQLEQLNKG